MACAHPLLLPVFLRLGLLFAPPAPTIIPTTNGTTTMGFALFVPRPQSCPRFSMKLFEPDAVVLRNNGLLFGHDM